MSGFSWHLPNNHCISCLNAYQWISSTKCKQRQLEIKMSGVSFAAPQRLWAEPCAQGGQSWRDCHGWDPCGAGAHRKPEHSNTSESVGRNPLCSGSHSSNKDTAQTRTLISRTMLMLFPSPEPCDQSWHIMSTDLSHACLHRLSHPWAYRTPQSSGSKYLKPTWHPFLK